MILLASLGIGILAGIFTSLIGGAAGFISVPLLLLLGLPTYTAVSTPKFGAVGVALGSLIKFRKKNYIRTSLVPILTVLAIIAGIVGSFALLQVPEDIIEKAIIVLLGISVIALWSKKDMGVVGFAVSRARRITGYIAYLISETLRAGFGAGFGLLTNTVITYFFGLTTLESTATKRIPGLMVTSIALAIFLTQGVINIPVGIALMIGSTTGSYIGTHYAIALGNKWAKYLFTVFAIGMIISLSISFSK